MRPLIELGRFFRPSFAGQHTRLSAIARKHFSSSANCTNTADGLRSADDPEVLDSSQTISAVTAKPREGQQAVYTKRSAVRWSTDELRKLRDADEKCMGTKAIAALFPSRTFNSVLAQRKLLIYSPRRTDARLLGPSEQGKKPPRWQPAEIELLQRLHKDGASHYSICAHFPARSPRGVYTAFQRFVAQSARPSRGRRIWSQEDTQYLTEHALQGADANEIAKALDRTPKSVWSRATNIGVRFVPKIPKFSTEESEQIQQMRVDGTTYREIAATLGRPLAAVSYHWQNVRAKDDHYVRQYQYHPATQLSLDDYQTIRSLRDQAASWSSIRSLFPQYQLDSIKQDFWRFTKCELSATDMRTIQDLRQEGESWRAIVATGDYPMKTGHGLKGAYDRKLKNKAEE